MFVDVDTIAAVCALWVAVDDITRVLKEVAVVVAATVDVWFGVVVGG